MGLWPCDAIRTAPMPNATSTEATGTKASRVTFNFMSFVIRLFSAAYY